MSNDQFRAVLSLSPKLVGRKGRFIPAPTSALRLHRALRLNGFKGGEQEPSEPSKDEVSRGPANRQGIHMIICPTWKKSPMVTRGANGMLINPPIYSGGYLSANQPREYCKSSSLRFRKPWPIAGHWLEAMRLRRSWGPRCPAEAPAPSRGE